MATFGEMISEKRRALDLSQRELAARILKEDGTPISPQYLNDLERDRRNAPSDHLINEFSRELNIPKDALYLCAGEIPPDIRCLPVDQDVAVKAFKAFRRTLKDSDK